jgi:hypothetical protein
VNREYFVYGLFRPDTGSIFYVGMSCKTTRPTDHVRFRKRGRSYKDNLICHFMDDEGYADIPFKILKGDLTRQEAIDLEIALIYAIGRHPHGPLTNIVKGGEGLADPTPEFRERHGALMKEKLASPETRATMSAKAKARDRTGEWEQKRKEAARSPEARAKQSLARKGKPLWPNGRLDPRSEEGKQIWAEKNAGKVFYHNGILTKKFRPGEEPQGWVRGRAWVFSEETRDKMRAAKVGRKLSEEHKQKVGLAHKGQKRASFDKSWWSTPEGRSHVRSARWGRT